ncbi:hypothetical cytosolic protein [Syntrophus aciditrophicus SB]|uniref:Hypothetical cytosolic protein n=1 Tax=Syntrophus aciditrophicus (strain SB) TaxID=56780 RepID=Q2LQC3_SYNAS|nr:hypothetical cytosolic protein [Syntrophus aciditrophicus SB]
MKIQRHYLCNFRMFVKRKTGSVHNFYEQGWNSILRTALFYARSGLLNVHPLLYSHSIK